jgi:ATP-dependent DNA ligase
MRMRRRDRDTGPEALLDLESQVFVVDTKGQYWIGSQSAGYLAVFLAPQLIAQVSFQEWTADKKLRQPVFLGLRDDKRPQDVLLPGVPA